MRIDAQMRALAAQASLKDGADVEPAGDLVDRCGAALEVEGRGSRRDLQQADAAQRIDDGFGQAVRQEILSRIAAQIGERQNRDGTGRRIEGLGHAGGR